MRASTRRPSASRSACGATRAAEGSPDLDREAAGRVARQRLCGPRIARRRIVEDGEYHPVVIAETTRPIHRLSVSDAVLELDLTGAPAVVFHHAGTGRVNVVYRRHDGAIGWIDLAEGRS